MIARCLGSVLSVALTPFLRAAVILVMDHRGCQRGGPNKEYKGEKSGDQDDEMCVKVYRMSCRPLKFAPSLTRAFRDPVSCMPDSFAWNTPVAPPRPCQPPNDGAADTGVLCQNLPFRVCCRQGARRGHLPQGQGHRRPLHRQGLSALPHGVSGRRPLSRITRHELRCPHCHRTASVNKLIPVSSPAESVASHRYQGTGHAPRSCPCHAIKMYRYKEPERLGPPAEAISRLSPLMVVPCTNAFVVGDDLERTRTLTHSECVTSRWRPPPCARAPARLAASFRVSRRYSDKHHHLQLAVARDCACASS